MSCMEVLSSAELPSPLKIAKRPDLRADVIVALAERWRMRYSRIQAEGSRAPVKVTTREALILDKLGMWSEFGIPLADPRVKIERGEEVGSTPISQPLRVPVVPHASVPPGAVTTILVRNRDGVVTPLTMDSRAFVDTLVKLSRAHPTMGGRELVGFYVELMLDELNLKAMGESRRRLS